MLQRYAKKGARPVHIDKKDIQSEDTILISTDLVNPESGVTHDAKKLANVLMDLINEMRTDLSPELLQYYLKRYNIKHR